MSFVGIIFHALWVMMFIQTFFLCREITDLQLISFIAFATLYIKEK